MLRRVLAKKEVVEEELRVKIYYIIVKLSNNKKIKSWPYSIHLLSTENTPEAQRQEVVSAGHS